MPACRRICCAISSKTGADVRLRNCCLIDTKTSRYLIRAEARQPNAPLAPLQG